MIKSISGRMSKGKILFLRYCKDCNNIANITWDGLPLCYKCEEKRLRK